MVRALAAALVVAYLPGLLIFRTPTSSRTQRAALPAEERAFWAILISLSLSLALVLAMAGIGRYTFSRLLMLDAAVSFAILIVARGRLRYGSTAARTTWTALVPVGLVAVGLALYFPPAEYVIGGKDPGVYLNEGIQIAQRGELIYRDPVVATVPPVFRDLFFPAHVDQQSLYYGLRFMGFFIQNPNDGRVVSQFPHLFPASIAIGYGLNGLSGARQAVAVWAILGLLAVYFAGARIFGRGVAAAAAGLLAINVVEVWFARYPNSELVMQALLFAAILAFGRAMDGPRVFFGAVAGVLLGLMFFLRYEVLLAVLAFSLAAIAAPLTNRRIGWAFALSLVAVGGAGFWYLAGPMKAYSELPLRFTRESGGWWLAGGTLVAAWLARLSFRWPRWRAVVLTGLPIALTALLVVLAVYAYFFRHEGNGTAPHDAMALRTFAWYLTPWALAAAVIGIAVLTPRWFWRDVPFFLTFAAFALFFFYKTRIVPVHFWAARRFLVMGLPGSLLFVTAFADDVLGPHRLKALAGRLRPRPVVASSAPVPPWMVVCGVLLTASALAPLGIAFWHASAPIRQHVEYAGLIPRLEHLAGQVGARDLLIVESRNAGSDLHVLALPLADIYGKNVLVLDSPVPPKRSLEDFVTWARTRYDRVLFLGGGGTDLLTKQLAAEPLAGDRFQVPEYDAPTNAYPSGPTHKEFEFGLYKLVAAPVAPGGPLDFAIGALDDLNVVRFYAKERRPDSGVTFRWTRGASYVLLLGIDAGARHLTIWMSNGGRPASVPPAVVEVALDDVVLGTARTEDALRPYTFDIPPVLAARAAAALDPMRLRLSVPTWNPARVLGGPDTRDLGVMVSRVEVR